MFPIAKPTTPLQKQAPTKADPTHAAPVAKPNMVEDESKQLMAALAYNRFMEKRVKYLEYQLSLHTSAAQAQAVKKASDSTKSGVEGGGPAGNDNADTEEPDAQRDLPRDTNTLVSENIQLQSKLRQMKQDLQNTQRESSVLKVNLEVISKKWRAEKERSEKLDTELTQLKDLLPPHLFESSSRDTSGVKSPTSERPRGDDSSSHSMGGKQRSETLADEIAALERNSNMIAHDNALLGPPGSTGADNDASSTFDPLAATMQKQSDSAGVGGSDEDEAAPATSPSMMECKTDPIDIYNTQVELLRYALSFAQDDSLLDDPTDAPEAGTDPQAATPSGVPAATPKPKTQLDLALAMFPLVEKQLHQLDSALRALPLAVSEFASARRNAVSFIVESQAIRSKVPIPTKIRATTLKSLLEGSRQKLDKTKDQIQHLAPQVVHSCLLAMAATTGVALYHRHIPEFSACLRAAEENLRKVMLIPSKVSKTIDTSPVTADITFSEFTKHIEEGIVDRFDLSQLKDLSQSIRTSSDHLSLYRDCGTDVSVVTRSIDTVRRVIRGEKSALLLSAEGNLPTVSRAHHKGTQVNFFAREVTATDIKLRQLAAIRQPWFECVKDVSPRIRALTSRSPSPTSAILRRRLADHGDGVQEEHGDVGDSNDESSEEANDDWWSAERAKVFLHTKSQPEVVDRLIAQYKLQGLPLPSNFERVPGPKTDRFRFGTKVVAITPDGGGRTLNVHIGGGFVKFDEFVGRHHRSETLKIDSAAERDRIAKTPPARVQLPPSPRIRLSGPVAKQLAASRKKASMRALSPQSQSRY